jgi:hypothetical protein
MHVTSALDALPYAGCPPWTCRMSLGIALPPSIFAGVDLSAAVITCANNKWLLDF